MRHVLFFIAFLSPILVSAQSSYISTNGNIILESGAIEEYNQPDIYCEGTYQRRIGIWQVIVQLKIQGGTSADGFVKTFQINIPEADIDALTCSGSDNSDKTQNCILQAVKDYLLVLNPSITFTLN